MSLPHEQEYDRRTQAAATDKRASTAPNMRADHVETLRRNLERAHDARVEADKTYKEARERYEKLVPPASPASEAAAISKTQVTFLDVPKFGFSEEQKAKARTINGLHPKYDHCLLTRDGVAVMATRAQYRESFEIRRSPPRDISCAEAILEVHPDQKLSTMFLRVVAAEKDTHAHAGRIQAEMPHLDFAEPSLIERVMAAAEPGAKVKFEVTPLDTQVGGAHYKKMKIQVVEFVDKNQIPYLEGNAIKYICRHAEKGGVQDIDKAIHYLQLLKELRYGTAE